MPKHEPFPIPTPFRVDIRYQVPSLALVRVATVTRTPHSGRRTPVHITGRQGLYSYDSIVGLLAYCWENNLGETYDRAVSDLTINLRVS